jgi:hypothetical protein
MAQLQRLPPFRPSSGRKKVAPSNLLHGSDGQRALGQIPASRLWLEQLDENRRGSHVRAKLRLMDRIDVVARGSYNHVWHWAWNGASWSAEDIYGEVSSAPAVASRGVPTSRSTREAWTVPYGTKTSPAASAGATGKAWAAR